MSNDKTLPDVDTDQSCDCLPNLPNKGNDEEFTEMRIVEAEQTSTRVFNESDTILNEFLDAVDDADHHSRSSTEVLRLFDFDEQRCLTLAQPLFSSNFSTATDCKHELEAFHPGTSYIYEYLWNSCLTFYLYLQDFYTFLCMMKS